VSTIHPSALDLHGRVWDQPVPLAYTPPARVRPVARPARHVRVLSRLRPAYVIKLSRKAADRG
jgi:hypothetical protein